MSRLQDRELSQQEEERFAAMAQRTPEQREAEEIEKRRGEKQRRKAEIAAMKKFIAGLNR